MKIVDISIKRPIYVIVLFTVLSVLGFISYRSLNAELMPKFTPPMIQAQIIYPGASPSEVENSLTRKVEDALSGMAGVEKVQAYSYEGMSMLFVSFVYGTDIDKSITDAYNLLNAKRAELPRDILTPTIAKINVDDKPIITLSASSNLEATAFYDLMDKQIVPDLSRIKGTAKITMIGGQAREIQVNLDEQKMRAYGITPMMIQGVIRASNMDFPTGNLKSSEMNTAIRLSGKLKSVEEIRNLILTTLPNGTQVRLSDLAEVTDAIKDPVKLARVNGKDAILINIAKQSDANAIQVSDKVNKTIDELQQKYKAQDLKVDITQDSTLFTRESIKAVLVDLMLAILLVAVVMLLFLHNFRNALIVMVVVPVSLIATFIGMQLLGFSLNLMSLLGLSLVIGVLVDDAIVIIENVYRHIEMGKNRVRASVDALNEIGFTVISITLVLVVVFLPIALTNTLVSDILRQFCVVIVISTLFSLLAAFTLVPLLTSRFGNIQKLNDKNIFQKILIGFEKLIARFTNWIADVLAWALGHKRWVIIGVVAITVAVFSLFRFGFIGFEFLPVVDRGEFIVQLEMPKDISMEESNKLVRRAENWLRSKPEVLDVTTMVGVTSDNTQSTQGTPYLAEIEVKLVPKNQRNDNTQLYITKLQQPLSAFLVNAKVKLFTVSLTGTAAKAAVEYVISGSNADSVMAFADKALDIMRAIPGTMQQQLSVESGTPEIAVTVDRDKMSALGLTLDNVAVTMQMTFQGNNTLKFTEGNYEYDINIRADKYYRQQVEDIENLVFINNKSEAVKLSQFADIRLGTGPNKLERFNRNSSVTIRSQVFGVSSGAVSSQFLEKITEIKPASIHIEATGDMKSMGESMSALAGALLLSVLLIYLLMVVLYNNWTDPLVVMFSIPLCIIGAILALALTNTPLSIYGMLGFVMLIGLSAKNAILLVDFANDAIKEGKTTKDALIQSVRIRTRPILMTALSVIIGMLPVALASSAGSELRNGMAWVIIGGMIISTLFTLVVVPVVYVILHSFGKTKKATVDIERLMVE